MSRSRETIHRKLSDLCDLYAEEGVTPVEIDNKDDGNYILTFGRTRDTSLEHIDRIIAALAATDCGLITGKGAPVISYELPFNAGDNATVGVNERGRYTLSFSPPFPLQEVSRRLGYALQSPLYEVEQRKGTPHRWMEIVNASDIIVIERYLERTAEQAFPGSRPEIDYLPGREKRMISIALDVADTPYDPAAIRRFVLGLQEIFGPHVGAAVSEDRIVAGQFKLAFNIRLTNLRDAFAKISALNGGVSHNRRS